MAVRMAPRQDRAVDTALLRLKRVSDLFVEGTEVVLSEDPLVMVWVNKLNSFEDDEARKDGLAYRSLAQLRIEREGDFHPAIAGYIAEFEAEDKDGRAKKLADLFSQEDLIAAMNEVDGADEWQEKGNMLRHGEMLADDATVEEQAAIAAETMRYFEAIQQELERRNIARAGEFKSLPDAELSKQFRKKVVEIVTLDNFVKARDVSVVFFALRHCDATKPGEHAMCRHDRLLEDRKQVESLPEGLVAKVKEALENIDVNPREAGNSDAPTPSSESSERLSEPEESVPSTPRVMSSVSLPA